MKLSFCFGSLLIGPVGDGVEQALTESTKLRKIFFNMIISRVSSKE
jgi:hypothetical protein